MIASMQTRHTCRAEQVAETKAILYVKVHDRTIQCFGMFFAQIIDPSVSMLAMNLSRPIDQPNSLLLQFIF